MRVAAVDDTPPVRREEAPTVIELAIEVEVDPRPRNERIDDQKPRETLAVALDRQPKSVILDPRTYLLMDAEVTQAPGAR